MTEKKLWHETLYSHSGQHFLIDNILCHKKTNYQDILFFENSVWGRVMALDGVLQTTEKDGFIYPEMIAHTPLFAHGKVKKVLIIGGGDGAMLREVCRHKEVEQVTMVEIDADVIALCRQYLPDHSANAYEDPRVKLIIGDGTYFVNHTDEKFDVIICDCSDPIGPNSHLYTAPFYQNCANILNKNGIFVAHNCVCLLQQDVVITSYTLLKQYFNDVSFCQVTIPSYYGGIMLFAWASQNALLRQHHLTTLKQRFTENKLHCRYYNPEMHISCFALPQYLLDAMNNP